MRPARWIPYSGADLRGRFDNNSCSYCIIPIRRGARKGNDRRAILRFLAVVGMASQTNALVTGLQLPVDAAFLVES